MGYKAVNFHKKFALINEQWQPKVVARLTMDPHRQAAPVYASYGIYTEYAF